MNTIDLIVALGNPGAKYELTRHNAGFIVADFIIDEFGFEYVGIKGASRLYETQFEGRKIRLIKPETYMNRSGIACRQIAQYFKINYESMLVITDELDIDMGRLRFRSQGSAGTHNGLKSIIQETGSKLFPRIRVGIGPKPNQYSSENFVLGTFTQDECDQLSKCANQVVEAIPSLLTGDWNQGSLKINTKRV